MGSLAATLLAVVMIAAFALAIGGIRLVLRKKDRKHGALMLIMAAVLIGNVLVWTI